MITMETRSCKVCQSKFTCAKTHSKMTCSPSCAHKSIGKSNKGQNYMTVKTRRELQERNEERTINEAHLRTILSVEYGDEGNVL